MTRVGVTGLLAFLVLGLDVAAAGWQIGQGFIAARTADRLVTVRGLAEREAKADLALWPLRLVSTSDDLATAQAELRRAEGLVQAFMTAGGIPPEALEVQGIEVTDLLAHA